MRDFFTRYKTTILYGTGMALLLFLLRWLQLRLLIIRHLMELYTGLIAFIFTALGIWLALRLVNSKVKTVVVEKEVYVPPGENFVPNEKALQELGLSTREMEVLQLMAQGLSNQEIASQLFISFNTVKTHAARLFEKMEVSRRTQAIGKAKKLGLIP